VGGVGGVLGEGGDGGTSGEGGDGGTSGEGGDGDAGLCDTSDAIASTSAPSCALTNNEPTCRRCLKSRTCKEWQQCYGEQPRSACGYATHPDDDGQFDCIVFCFAEGDDASQTPEDLLLSCADNCENQCNLLNEDTVALVGAAYDKCTEECFPY
jgi:hypothetical protein